MDLKEQINSYIDYRIKELSDKRKAHHLGDEKFSTQLWSRINELQSLKTKINKVNKTNI